MTHLEARFSPRLEIGLDVPRVQIGDAHQEARSSEGPEFTKAKQLERGRVTQVNQRVHHIHLNSSWVWDRRPQNGFELENVLMTALMDHTITCMTSVNFGRHFWFSLSLYLETKMLNSLSHIWVFHSFSRQKVIAFLSTFSQTAVTNIYFGSYFICGI